jgi:outer membrane murein-binding lipoprotein Lpp
MPESKFVRLAIYVVAVVIYAGGCGLLIWKSNEFQEQAELKSSTVQDLRSKLEGLEKDREILLQKLEMYSQENATLRAQIYNMK